MEIFQFQPSNENIKFYAKNVEANETFLSQIVFLLLSQWSEIKRPQRTLLLLIIHYDY